MNGKKFYCEECGAQITEEDDGICDECAEDMYDDEIEDMENEQ